MGLGDLRRRLFARYYDRVTGGYEAEVRDRKRRLLSPLSGTVVEIGPGTGWNLSLLPPGVRWIGVEPNEHMHGPLREKARSLGLEIELHAADAAALPLEDASADAVIATLVLCSVPDLPAVLSEVRRVLKPGGRFVFWEHVLAPEGAVRRGVQHAITPLWRLYADGCRCNRDTGAAIRDAGFAGVELESFEAPEGFAPNWIRPHVAGTATA